MKEVLSTNPIKYNVWEKRFVDLEDLIEVRDMIGSMCQKDMLPHLFQNQNKSNIVYSIYQRINQALIDLDSDIDLHSPYTNNTRKLR